MKTDNLLEIAQQTFRIAIGATAALLETIQDTEKRSTAIEDLQAELERKSQQWAEKGEITEREARQKLEQILQKTPWKGRSTSISNPSSSNSNNYPITTDVSPITQSELQSLTEQITALRNELEQLRNNKNDN
jgi:polyhydroxyalkanoate synthesis regulator phasin